MTRPYVFEDVLAGPTSSPLGFCQKTKKWPLSKTWSKKKMLDGEGYVFRSGGVLSTMLLTHQVRRDTTISNMSS